MDALTLINNLEATNPAGLSQLRKLSEQTKPDFAAGLKVAQEKLLNRHPSDKEQKKAQLREVAFQMEAMFINMMLKEMRATLHKTDLFDAGFAQDVFEDMLYQEYAKTMAKTANFGLAEQIYHQMESYL